MGFSQSVTFVATDTKLRSNEMTREQATQNIDEIDFLTWQIDIIEDMLDQIFNNHEAQLKAKESDLERQDMIIKCLNIDLDNKEKLLKAKDEEIKELGEIVQQYLIPSKNYDAIIKAKDEEIVKLKLELFRSSPKIANKKTRSIVAMLFWEWRRLETEGITEEAFAAKVCFYKAYALLKGEI